MLANNFSIGDNHDLIIRGTKSWSRPISFFMIYPDQYCVMLKLFDLSQNTTCDCQWTRFWSELLNAFQQLQTGSNKGKFLILIVMNMCHWSAPNPKQSTQSSKQLFKATIKSNPSIANESNLDGIGVGERVKINTWYNGYVHVPMILKDTIP